MLLRTFSHGGLVFAPRLRHDPARRSKTASCLHGRRHGAVRPLSRVVLGEDGPAPVDAVRRDRLAADGIPVYLGDSPRVGDVPAPAGRVYAFHSCPWHVSQAPAHRPHRVPHLDVRFHHGRGRVLPAPPVVLRGSRPLSRVARRCRPLTPWRRAPPLHGRLPPRSENPASGLSRRSRGGRCRRCVTMLDWP